MSNFGLSPSEIISIRNSFLHYDNCAYRFQFQFARKIIIIEFIERRKPSHQQCTFKLFIKIKNKTRKNISKYIISLIITLTLRIIFLGHGKLVENGTKTHELWIMRDSKLDDRCLYNGKCLKIKFINEPFPSICIDMSCDNSRNISILLNKWWTSDFRIISFS